MSDLGGRNNVQNTVHHTQASAQDRNNGYLFAGQYIGCGLAQRRLDLDGFQRKITGDLISHQHSDLTGDLAEFPGSGLLFAQPGQFVLQQRMIQLS